MLTRAWRRAARTGPGFLVLALAAAGCSGEDRLTLNGSVSYQGKPLPAGMVRIRSDKDHVSVAKVRPDGTFIATDVFSGEVRVAVEEDPSAAMRQRMAASDPAHTARNAPAPAARPVAIPARYQDVETSGLVYTVTSGTRSLDIELK